MTGDKVIPLALVALQVSACVVCFFCRKWLDALYWFGGAVLTLSVYLR